MPTESTQAIGDNSSDDQTPVADSETLIRRILKRLPDYNREKTPPLQAGAFFPTKRDDDGLSMNRRVSSEHPQFLDAEQLKNWHEVPDGIRETCGVLAISAATVREVGLTITPNPSSSPGHVLVEEINWADFEENEANDEARTRILGWALQLAKRADILIAPGKPPLRKPAPP